MRDMVIRDVLRAALAVLAAFLLYAFLGGLGPAALVVLNAFTLIVVAFSIGRGEIYGGVLGSVCGLVQDSFSMGVFGVAGLTKALLGFWTGYVSRRIDVTPPLRLAGFLWVMTSLELLLWILVNAVVLRENPLVRGGVLFLQPVVTTILASVLLGVKRRAEARRI
jgi:rod shape-determining protein MreD